MQIQKRSLKSVIREFAVILFLLLGGAYFIYIAAHGFVTNQVSTIGRDSSWMTRADYPAFFWISIIFHGSSGIFAMWIGAKMLRRVLKLQSSKQ
jgi:hypothetical protein